ncbi:MAG: glycosyltransferase family 4 protein, partial [Anaerolineales bacterium]|nr:glycosyltransferase family 4 protein [Anaerolineales bacterium]
ILICSAQVPFVRGGAEMLAEGLRDALEARGHHAEIVALPFQWLPHAQLFQSALAWRLLDLTNANGVKIDRIIATKFPSYAAQHPHKIVWLVHQYRQAYDWYGAPLSEFTASPQDQQTREKLFTLDRRALGEARARFAISKNVAARLKRFNALEATPLYPPPKLTGKFYADDYGDYVLYIGRLDRAKRIDLLLRAAAKTKRGRVIIAGTGAEEQSLKHLAQALNIASRVEFPGFVDEARVLDLYARARAVYYAPVDEDYGFVTVEALMSARPVITTDDAGGVLEFIENENDGWVTRADENEIAQALARAFEDSAACRALGERGRERVREISWDTVV